MNVPDSCRILFLGELFLSIFGDKTDGSFVEVGAYDGLSFSNTSCLAEIGWRGLLFEPLPWAYQECVSRYEDNDHVGVINCCIGHRDGKAKLYKGDFLSTTKEEAIEHNNPIVKMSKENFVMSDMYKLDSMLDACGWETEFDLLVVDTKGTEMQVLRGFDIERWSPRMVIVDITDDEKQVAQYFKQKYKKIWCGVMDAVYLRDLS
jgi:FkbM family methyltransferase